MNIHVYLARQPAYIIIMDALWTFIVLFALNFAAAEITDIRFNITTPGLKKGVILLKFNDAWVTICHHGEPNTWGKRESIVACRQLGFKGGWPTEHVEREDQLEHLNNFDCDGTEEEMNDCGYEIPDQCLESKVAGVHCYDYFEIEISGGETTNLGRVEVRYDDEWSNVCYDSRESETRQWNIYNAQVVCKELGYPGTMFARRGGVGQGNRTSAVDGFKCREDLRDESLQDCLPDYPVRSEQSGGSACDHELTAKDNYAVAVCAVPGYVGCFTLNADTNQISSTKLESTNMTITICRNHCRNLNYTYTYLYKGDTCFCEDTSANELAGDRECRQECSGNDWEACGGRATVSIYEVNSGVCLNYWNTSDVFYFGHTLSSHDLCEPGWKPIGASVLQCVLGGSPGEVVWNDTVPTCEYIPGGNDNKGAKGGFDIKVVTIVSCCAAVVLVLCIIICVVVSRVLRKRKLRKRKLKIKNDETKEQLKDYDVVSFNDVEQATPFVDTSDTNILSEGWDKLKSAFCFNSTDKNSTDEGEEHINLLKAGGSFATKPGKQSKSTKLKFDETYFGAEDCTTEKHEAKPNVTGPCKGKGISGKKKKNGLGKETEGDSTELEELNDRKLRENQPVDPTSSNTSDVPEMYQNKGITDRIKEAVMENVEYLMGQGDKERKDKPTEDVINSNETQISIGVNSIGQSGGTDEVPTKLRTTSKSNADLDGESKTASNKGLLATFNPFASHKEKVQPEHTQTEDTQIDESNLNEKDDNEKDKQTSAGHFKMLKGSQDKKKRQKSQTEGDKKLSTEQSRGSDEEVPTTSDTTAVATADMDGKSKTVDIGTSNEGLMTRLNPFASRKEKDQPENKQIEETNTDEPTLHAKDDIEKDKQSNAKVLKVSRDKKKQAKKGKEHNNANQESKTTQSKTETEDQPVSSNNNISSVDAAVSDSIADVDEKSENINERSNEGLKDKIVNFITDLGKPTETYDLDHDGKDKTKDVDTWEDSNDIKAVVELPIPNNCKADDAEHPLSLASNSNDTPGSDTPPSSPGVIKGVVKSLFSPAKEKGHGSGKPFETPRNDTETTKRPSEIKTPQVGATKDSRKIADSNQTTHSNDKSQHTPSASPSSPKVLSNILSSPSKEKKEEKEPKVNTTDITNESKGSGERDKPQANTNEDAEEIKDSAKTTPDNAISKTTPDVSPSSPGFISKVLNHVRSPSKEKKKGKQEFTFEPKGNTTDMTDKPKGFGESGTPQVGSTIVADDLRDSNKTTSKNDKSYPTSVASHSSFEPKGNTSDMTDKTNYLDESGTQDPFVYSC